MSPIEFCSAGILLKKTFILLGKLSLVAAIFGYLISQVKISFSRILAGSREWRWILVSFLLFGGVLFNNSYRWNLLLRAQGSTLSYWRSLKFNFVGQFFSTVLPGLVGGDLVKAFYLVRYQNEPLETTSSIIVDRFVGLLAVCFLMGIAFVANFSFGKNLFAQTGFSQPIFLGIVAIFLLLLYFIFFSNLLEKMERAVKWKALQRIFAAFQPYKKTPELMIQAFLLSLCGVILNVLIFFSVTQALGGSTIPWALFFLIIPLGFFILGFPISPLGL